MTPLSAPVLATGSLGESHGTDRERLSAAAEQFEAIFLRQMLSAARKADFGAPLLGGQGLDTFRTMQDEHFAALASQSGAFGLAAQIEAQLARFVESPSRLREGSGVGKSNHSLGTGLAHPQPLPQAGGE